MRPFIFPTTTPSWFLGHMARSLRDLPELLKDIDLVIEARDARLPLTSINGAFDVALERAWGQRSTPPSLASHTSGMGSTGGSSNWRNAWVDRKGKGKEKVVVYTKRDLAEEKYEEPLRKAFLQHASQPTFFVDTQSDADLRKVLKHAIDAARLHQATMPEGMKILVTGMPNVGKSSLLNGLRRVGMQKGKAFRTGATPGLTRKLTGTVKIYEDPLVYVYDTPGVMVPYLGKGEIGSERGLKLAATAGIKDGLFDEETIAEYLLWVMSRREELSSCGRNDEGIDTGLSPSSLSWQSLLPSGSSQISSDAPPEEVFGALAERLGTLRKGGERDIDAARGWFLRAWREGRLGRWTLDDFETTSTSNSTSTLSLPSSMDSTPNSLENSVADPTPAMGGLDLSSIFSTGLRKGDSEGLTLDQKVSLTVRTFLATAARTQAANLDKRELSLTQEKKLQVKKENAERLDKWAAKGIKVNQPSSGKYARSTRGSASMGRKRNVRR